jgi:hypothetical protein
MLSFIKADCHTNLLGRYLVATTTVWSGASYIYTKDAVKILNQDDLKKAEPPKDEGKHTK